MKVRTARSRKLENQNGLAHRMASMQSVAEEFGSFRPASQVLTSVRAVPTIFPLFDNAVRVGGLPIERFSLVHGPSGGGKTYYCIGLMKSFLQLGFPVFFVDAERTTPIPWLRMAMGPLAEHPLFFAVKPSTYEQTRLDVRSFLNKVKLLRDAGKLPGDSSGLVVVDSIKKLVPKDQFDMILAESKKLKRGKAKQEGARSRIDQQKAAMNAAWLDELIVLLDETSTAMVTIAREIVDPDNTDPRAKMFGTNVKTGGGVHLYYDASLDIRVSRAKSYGRESEGKFLSYGDIHRVDITKSKVSGKEQFKATCTFHISNGGFTPAGFDTARDVVEAARMLHVIEGSNWLKYRRHKWRNADLAVKSLTADAVLLAEIDRETRALFKKAG